MQHVSNCVPRAVAAVCSLLGLLLLRGCCLRRHTRGAGLGGAELAQTPTMQQIVVSRAECVLFALVTLLVMTLPRRYEEKGHIACRQKMHQL